MKFVERHPLTSVSDYCLWLTGSSHLVGGVFTTPRLEEFKIRAERVLADNRKCF